MRSEVAALCPVLIARSDEQRDKDEGEAGGCGEADPTYDGATHGSYLTTKATRREKAWKLVQATPAKRRSGQLSTSRADY